jgi:FKBP-type peptidyl-prolyl cis-trans isomerase
MTSSRRTICHTPSHGSSLLALTAILVGAALPAAAKEVKVESDTEKAIYLIGVDFAQRLQPLYLTEAEVEIVARGLRDQVAGKAMQLDPQVYGPKLTTLQQERAKDALAAEAPKAAAYIAEQAKQPGAKTTESGLVFTEVSAGSGESPAAGSKVAVHYTGTLRDGRVFDSSVQRGQPAEFVIGQVIKCWNEALPMMKVGGKARLVCPASIAYGDGGVPGAIPPGAVLTFDVELLSVE